MEFLKELLPIIFMFVVIPAIGVLTSIIVAFINEKKEEIKKKIDNETLQKYVDMLAETVIECVVVTNNTYVNALKEQGAFDAEAQKKAFKMTYDAVMAILSKEAIEYLEVFYGDLQKAIEQLIEKDVTMAWNRIPSESEIAARKAYN